MDCASVGRTPAELARAPSMLAQKKDCSVVVSAGPSRPGENGDRAGERKNMRIEVLTTAELRNRVANNWRPDELVLVDNKRSRKDRLYGRKIMEVKVHPINWDGVIN